MSIIRPIVRSVVRSIVSFAVGFGRYFSIFGGKHIELGEILLPDSADFAVEFTIRPAAGDVGANTTILAQHTITAPRILTSGTDVLRVIYVNTGASSTTISATTDIEAGVDMRVVFVSNSITGTEIFINGVLESMSSAIVDHTVFGIDMIGSRHDHGFNFQGEIFDASIPNGAGLSFYPINEASGLVVADNSYQGAFDSIPRSEWITGNPVDLSGDFQVVDYAGDHSVEVDIEFTGASIRVVGNSSDFFSRILAVSNGDIQWRPTTGTDAVDVVGVLTNGLRRLKFTKVGTLCTIFVDGVDVGSAVIAVASVAYNSIFDNDGLLDGGVIGNLKFTDDTTGETIEYNLNNIIDNGDGSGTGPQTGSESGREMMINNYDSENDLTLITAPTDGIWTAEPERVRR